jgi:hypothetical protein
MHVFVDRLHQLQHVASGTACNGLFLNCWQSPGARNLGLPCTFPTPSFVEFISETHRHKYTSTL